MLRVYYNEPKSEEDTDKEIATSLKTQMKMANTLFTEMLQYIPKEDREDYREQYSREK